MHTCRRSSLSRVAFWPLLRLRAGVLAAVGLAAVWGLMPAQGSERGSASDTLRTVKDVWDARRDADAERPRPVDLEVLVGYYDPIWHLLWTENANEVAFLPVTRLPLPVRSRQRIRIVGEMVPTEGVHAARVDVQVIEPFVEENPVPGNGRLLDAARKRETPIRVRAYVLRQREPDANHLELDCVIDDRLVTARLWLEENEPVPNFAGQFVDAVGICTIPSPTSAEEIDVQLWIARSANVRAIGEPDAAELFAQPATALNQLGSTSAQDYVRLAGRMLKLESRDEFTLRTEDGDLRLRSPLAAEIVAGSEIEVIGVPVQRRGEWTLRDVICRPLQKEPANGELTSAGLPKLRLAQQVLLLLPDEARRGYPVQVNGVVTFSHPIFPVFFVEDASGGLCVRYEGTDLSRPAPGDVISLSGHSSRGDFAAVVNATGLALNGRGPFPAAPLVTLEHALTGVEDAQWVEMRGFLREVELRDGEAYLTMVAAGGEFVMRVPTTVEPPITLGSVLRASGVCGSVPNKKGQIVGVQLLVPSLQEIVIDDAAPADPFSRPLRKITSLRRYQPTQTLDRQVRVEGTVLHHVTGRLLLLQGDGEILRVLSRERTPLTPGDRVDVVGLPGRLSSQIVLREAVYRRTATGLEPEPLSLADGVPLDPELDGRLVRIQGTLVDLAAHREEGRLIVQTVRTLCDVVYDRELEPEQIERWQPGSKVALTGVYQVQFDEYDQPKGFSLLLRAPGDLTVLAAPSWWTVRRALMIAALLLGSHLLGLAWAGMLRRRVREQTAVIRTQLENETQLEARYREIVENASDFIFTTDRNGCFTSFNRAGENLTGFARSVAMRLTIFDLLDRREARLARRALARPDRFGDIKGLQTRLRRRDGSMVWVETSARFVRQNGAVVGVLGVVRDISVRKLMEEELKFARDAAEANTRAKSLFLANMSHEIRTPMNGVIGMSHLLLDTRLDEQQRDFAETIRASAESLLTVLNDILDFSKIEAGRLQLESIDFSLAETVDDALELLGARAAVKNLELAAFLPSGLPRLLRGDPGRLRQVLLNLIGNAVKFTERGHVTVHVTCEREEANHVYLRFAVGDTGVGIAPEARPHLFHAFHQADNSTSRRFGGTGLGLVISKQIVELMHGEIGVESTLGEGSTFWFIVRFEKMAASLPASAGSADLPCAGWRVLVVDDQPVSRAVVRHILGPRGVQVMEAADAATALTQLRRATAQGRPFQFILVDLQLAGIDGLTLARQIHDDAQIANAPIGLLASLDRPLAPEVREATGVVAFLTKPIRQDTLINLLLRHGPGRLNEPAGVIPTTDESNQIVATKPDPALSGLRVLVAEDNVVNQRLTCLQLQKFGLNADIASDGREVLEAIERTHYDVVLMDCQMPELDGFEATRRLRACGRHPDLRIIAMTANAMSGDRERCIEAGMDDYLSKPTRLDDLRQVLQRWAESRSGREG